MDEPPGKRRISTASIAIWVFAGAVGLYLLVSGLVGILSGG